MNFKEKMYILYAHWFAKKKFLKWNLFLFHLSLRGLGILNWRNDDLSGEKGFLDNYLKNREHPLVVDVGAHIGMYVKNILSANPEAEVIAFEPHPITYKKLLQNLTIDDKRMVKCYNLAVDEKQKNLKLYDYANNDGTQHASIYKDVINLLHGSQSICHEVKAITLDEFLDDEIKTIDLLKIDTEGNELNVLKGAQQLLKNHKIRAIQFEFNSMNTISKTMFKDFRDLLQDYDFFRILPMGEIYRVSSKYNPLLDELYAYQNIVALLKREYI